MKMTERKILTRPDPLAEIDPADHEAVVAAYRAEVERLTRLTTELERANALERSIKAELYEVLGHDVVNRLGLVGAVARLLEDKKLLVGKVGSLCVELEGWRRPHTMMVPSEQFSAGLFERLQQEAIEYRAWLEDRYADENCRVWGGCETKSTKCEVCEARSLLSKYASELEG